VGYFSSPAIRACPLALLPESCGTVRAVSETTPVAGRPPVSLGNATPGGGDQVYGEAVAATLNEVDPALDVRPRNTKDSTENVPLLEAGLELLHPGVRRYLVEAGLTR
jgi:TRAP-type uncharacterized transport system substrate-binding protein